MEPLILGEEEAPAIAEEDELAAVPQPLRAQSMRGQLLPEPEAQPRRRFGFLGRKEKRPEPRTEPVPARAEPRAQAQIIARGGEAAKGAADQPGR